MTPSVGFSVGLCFLLLSFAGFADSASNETAGSGKTSPKIMLVNWGNLDVVDFLRSGFLVVAFLATVLGDKRGSGRYGPGPWHWPAAETLAFIVAGAAAYFFPASVVEYQTNLPVQRHHIFEMQMTGSILLSMAVTTFSMNNLGTDALVGSSWLISRIVGGLCLLVALCYAQIISGIMSDQNATFAIFGVMLWCVGGLVQLGRSNATRSLTRPATEGCVTMHLLIDLFINLPIILLGVAQPVAVFQQIFGITADPVLVHMSLVSSILALIGCFQTLSAIFYDHDGDRKAVLLGRLALCILSGVVTGLYQWKHHYFSSNVFTGVMIMTAVMGANAAAGCFRSPRSATSR